MATPQQDAYHSRVIHHLGLVSGMIDELGLVERIDALIPKKEQQIVSYGQAVKAMILNGLGFTQRVLYLTPHFFRDKPVEHLIGEGITAAQLNDDLLGRTLDAIHARMVAVLFTASWRFTVSKSWACHAKPAIWIRPAFMPTVSITASCRLMKTVN